jgi:hypothetical protein
LRLPAILVEQTPLAQLAAVSLAIAMVERQDAIPFYDRLVTADELKLDAPDLSATLLKSFTNASTDENFWIYR